MAYDIECWFDRLRQQTGSDVALANDVDSAFQEPKSASKPTDSHAEISVVTYAVTEAIHLGAIGFDAVKLIALARTERRPVRLDLAAYPHLPRLTVQTTRAADYAALVPGMAA
jgi:hypothetical protein